ncbi:N-acetyl sugar amidotransferase [Tardiphaga alba]|uniref:N-acetyl sugar amidotransferase n=1 Tax=Tardiphaga alba TaxID=340268 RepID=A0ABX8ABD6_9BRAD|nr:N-acetyl sugar amidotransferase [Tardiphaga alba]QUS39110.1 N-acetyl sugar amidotransferase [Tardiphaga alba]
MLKYCSRCLYPESKPDLQFDTRGVCSACVGFETRVAVDWDKRREEFVNITTRYKSKNSTNYDCIVPVSGGKDSTYQVIRLLEYGLNPICVTSTTDSLSEIGRRNLENISKLGVDHIEVTTNPVIRRRINRLALTEIGDISWPEHVTIFTIPVRLATQLSVPLIVWGENSQHEYGGPAAAQGNSTLDRRWLEEFGGLLGLRVSDLIGIENIERRHLIQYSYPTDAELQSGGITGIFLGYYFPWDGYQNALIAQGYGFETIGTNVEGSLANYENLDNYQTGIHDYFKYLKFGFGRATDIANNHIRRGRLTRNDAKDLVRRVDGKFPWTYLGRPIEEILKEIDMTIDEFLIVCDRFTNKRLFKTGNDGKLMRDRNGELVPLFELH